MIQNSVTQRQSTHSNCYSIMQKIIIHTKENLNSVSKEKKNKLGVRTHVLGCVFVQEMVWPLAPTGLCINQPSLFNYH
jgi:hypothetical protein